MGALGVSDKPNSNLDCEDLHKPSMNSGTKMQPPLGLGRVSLRCTDDQQTGGRFWRRVSRALRFTWCRQGLGFLTFICKLNCRGTRWV